MAVSELVFRIPDFNWRESWYKLLEVPDPDLTRAGLESAISQLENWMTGLGLLAAFTAAVAAILGGLYFFRELKLRSSLGEALEVRRKKEKTVKRIGSFAAWCTVAAGILGFSVSILSLVYVMDNRKLRDLEADDRLKTQRRIENATKQANAAIAENINLRKELAALQQSQTAVANDAKTAYAGYVAAKAQLLKLEQQTNIIRNFEVEVRFVLNTEPSVVQSATESPFGLKTVAGLSGPHTQALYLINDSLTYEYQQVAPTQRKFRVIFHPYTAGQILGKKIDALHKFTKFSSGYTWMLQDRGTKLVAGSQLMTIIVRVNGVQAAEIVRHISSSDLLQQAFDIDVSKEFSAVEEQYSKLSEEPKASR